MTTIKVVRNSSGNTKNSSRRKMTISPLGSEASIVVPYAPREVTHSALAAEWEEVRRTARDPLVVRSNDPKPRMAFTLFFGHENPDRRVDGELRKLARFAKNSKPVRVNYSTWETGSWRISSMLFTSQLRHPESNEITRAEVEIEFVLAEGTTKHMGPLSGGVKKDEGGKDKGKKGSKAGKEPKKGSGHPKHYKVKRGDTLSEIAVKFYRDASKWRKIADANKIRNPRKLKVGKVLRLP